MTAEEAVRQAEAEGLALLKAESNTTGYKGVLINNGRAKPYQAEVRRGGKQGVPRLLRHGPRRRR